MQLTHDSVNGGGSGGVSSGTGPFSNRIENESGNATESWIACVIGGDGANTSAFDALLSRQRAIRRQCPRSQQHLQMKSHHRNNRQFALHPYIPVRWWPPPLCSSPRNQFPARWRCHLTDSLAPASQCRSCGRFLSSAPHSCFYGLTLLHKLPTP